MKVHELIAALQTMPPDAVCCILDSTLSAQDVYSVRKDDPNKSVIDSTLDDDG